MLLFLTTLLTVFPFVFAADDFNDVSPCAVRMMLQLSMSF